MAFAPDGKRLVTISSDRALIWDVTSGTSVAELTELNGNVERLAYSTDGRCIVCATLDNTAWVWPSKGGAPSSSHPYSFDDFWREKTGSPCAPTQRRTRPHLSRRPRASQWPGFQCR
jgi:WD40 repeat protein